MDFKKIINEEKKNIANKEKTKEIIGKFAGKVQEFANKGTKKANEFIDKKQQELENSVEAKFKKNIYAECISYVEKLIIEKNVNEPTPIYIIKDSWLEREIHTNVKTIIENVTPKNVDSTIYTESQDYLKNVYNVLGTYFASHEQLDVQVSDKTLIIKLKEIEINKNHIKDENVNTEESHCKNCDNCTCHEKEEVIEEIIEENKEEITE